MYGTDPFEAVSRQRQAASSLVSGASASRGGEGGETMIRRDGEAVWLVDPYGNRMYMICGAPLIGKSGKLCTKKAGHGTTHVGVGRCKKHPVPKAVQERMYRALILSAPGSPPNAFTPYVERAQSIMQRVDQSSPRQELLGLYTLLEMKKDALQPLLISTDLKTRLRAVDDIASDLTRIADLKAKIHKMELESGVVSTNEIDTLLVEFFDVLRSRLPARTRRPILEDLRTRVTNWSVGMTQLSGQLLEGMNNEGADPQQVSVQ